MEFAEATEGGVGRFGKEVVGDGCGEGEFVDGGADGSHDSLCAHRVEVFVRADVTA